MSLQDRIAQLPEKLAEIHSHIAEAAREAGRRPEEVKLCAVCKGQDAALIRESALLAIDCFGENKQQELAQHMAAGAFRDKPCHFVGHLQTNKARQVVGQVSLIHSVDSERLMKAVQNEAARLGRLQGILIQINIAAEASKTGAPTEALWPLIETALAMPALNLRGLMAIPPSFDNGPLSQAYFAQVRELYERARAQLSTGHQFDILSMGMSDSYIAAIREGATLIRVGRGIFGERA